MAKERDNKGAKAKREKMISTTFVCDTDLLTQIDDKAKSLDLNRGQYLRKLARQDLGVAGDSQQAAR